MLRLTGSILFVAVLIQSYDARVLAQLNVTSDQALATALAAATGGETILLAPGSYGRVKIAGGSNPHVTVGRTSAGPPRDLTSPVSVVSESESQPATIESLEVANSDKWRFASLVILPQPPRTAVYVTNSDDFHLKRSSISFGDSSEWTAREWLDRSRLGIVIQDSANSLVEDKLITTVDHAITINHDSPDAIVRGNVVDGIRGDGIRALGNNGLYERNILKNFVKVDDNHDDGIQAWSLSESGVIGEGVITGNILRGNVCIAYEDNDMPLRTAPQGIGLFDGPYKGWVIEDNIIATDHWHGITVAGAVDTIIQHNTAIDLNEKRPGPPWIRISNDKDGSRPENNTVRNNLMGHVGDEIPGNRYSNNVVVPFADYDKWFKDWKKFNFSVNPTAPNPDVGARVPTERNIVNPRQRD